jgi:hypothetical protein
MTFVVIEAGKAGYLTFGSERRGAPPSRSGPSPAFDVATEDFTVMLPCEMALP